MAIMRCLQFLIVFWYILNFSYAAHTQHTLFSSKRIQVTRFDGQCHGQNAPMQAFVKGIKCDTTKAFVSNSTLVIAEDLMENLNSSVTIERCESRENLDSCEEYYKMENIDYCMVINPDNILTTQSPFAIPYKPKYKCPIKKGIYHAYNFTLNLTPFIFFNYNGWYWKIKAYVFSPKENNRLLECTYVEGTV